MPNWCLNRLTLSGPLPLLRKFHEDFTVGGYPQLGNIVPDASRAIGYAAGVRAMRAPAWYDWRMKHWGTIADLEPSACPFEPDGDGWSFDFDTQRRPPVAWLEGAVKSCPGVAFKLEFVEPEHSFSGVVEFDQDGFYVKKMYHGSADTEIGHRILGDYYFEPEEPSMMGFDAPRG